MCSVMSCRNKKCSRLSLMFAERYATRCAHLTSPFIFISYPGPTDHGSKQRLGVRIGSSISNSREVALKGTILPPLSNSITCNISCCPACDIHIVQDDATLHYVGNPVAQRFLKYTELLHKRSAPHPSSHPLAYSRNKYASGRRHPFSLFRALPGQEPPHLRRPSSSSSSSSISSTMIAMASSTRSSMDPSLWMLRPMATSSTSSR
mmetsp:Transcript_20624/g.44572  ORF Transcript_20624/g.44572 Transcript_20624/m.44572 type:complete len:206 (+) Transcript_20624:168-785(+)